MSRLVDAAQLIGLLLSAALLWAAAGEPPARLPVMRVEVGRPIAVGADGVGWPVVLRLRRAAADVHLSVRLDGPAGHRHGLEVRHCPPASRTAGTISSASCTALIAASEVTRASASAVLLVGRTVTLDPGGAERLLVTATGVDDDREALRASVNATPCSAARAAELWVVERTRPRGDENTWRAAEQCATRPGPWLPLGLLVLASTLALRVADHLRHRRPR